MALVVVLLPFVPVTPTIRPGATSKKRLTSEVTRLPGAACCFEGRGVRREARRTEDHVGVRDGVQVVRAEPDALGRERREHRPLLLGRLLRRAAVGDGEVGVGQALLEEGERAPTLAAEPEDQDALAA